MILYLDTSSLVKLYVREDGSDEVMALLDGARVVATSQVAYAEARAAFARKHREGDFTEEQYHTVVGNLERDWGAYFVLDVSRPVSKIAGELAERHSLKGLDAIHLASALILSTRLGSMVTFSSSDRKLKDAARAASLNVCK